MGEEPGQDTRNSYSGMPDDFPARVGEAQTVALADQIRNAILLLTEHQSGRYRAVVALLASMIGEADDQ